ncbi:hypothetical protein BG004_007304, partial [Podila humilis]
MDIIDSASAADNVLDDKPIFISKQHHVHETRVRSSHSPALVLFFALLALNCLSSSIQSSTTFSSSPSLFPSKHSISSSSSLAVTLSAFASTFSLLKPCLAARNINSNQRVDAPSPDDYQPLTGPDFAFTPRTPLGALTDPREYVDGALATQKLVAASVIPLDRQLWPGIDTRTAYFGNNFGSEKVANVSHLLQAGMRRLVLDLWWDSGDLRWQLCPRIKTSNPQLATIRLALEHSDRRVEGVEEGPQLQGMGLPDSQLLRAQDLPNVGLTPLGSTTESSEASANSGMSPTPSNTKEGEEGTGGASLEKRSEAEKKQAQRHRPGPGSGSGLGSKAQSASEPTSKQHKGTGKANGRKSSHQKTPSPSTTNNPPGSADWFRRKRPHHRPPPIRPKAMGKSKPPHNHKSTETPPPPTAHTPASVNRVAMGPLSNNRNGGEIHRLAMSKGVVSSYNKALSTDQTTDGITCTTGDDLVMLLQTLQTWIQQSTPDELEDVFILILNLNELTNSSLGSRTPTPNTPAPAPVPAPASVSPVAQGTAGNNQTAPSTLSNEQFFSEIQSPNTNHTLKALLPNVISLKDLFLDAFPSWIYSPVGLETDRQDLGATWWSSGPVGLDYYNTTTDQTTGRTQTKSGWPTSYYLTEVIKRRTTCGFSPLVQSVGSSLSFSEQAALSVWSWDLNQPPINETRSRDRRCGAMQSNGRWTVQNCNLKLPVACRQIGTSASWLIYDKGSNNYRDVTCPEGYQFDVPRTARENQLLYQTLLLFWNTTNPGFYNSLMSLQSYEDRLLHAALQTPYYGSTASFKPNLRRHLQNEDDDDDDDNDNDGRDDDVDEEEEAQRSPRSRVKESVEGNVNVNNKASGEAINDGRRPPNAAKGMVIPMPVRAPSAAGVPGMGM